MFAGAKTKASVPPPYLKLPGTHRTLSFEGRAALPSRLILLVLILTVAYFILDKIITANVTTGIFVYIFFLCTGCLLLIGLGHIRIAKIFGVLLFNILLYNIAASEDYATGAHLHLATIGFVAIILFGHEDRLWGRGFIFLSFALYLLSYFWGRSLLDYRHFDHDQTNAYLLINCTVFASVNTYLTAMMLRFSHHAERILIEKNQRILRQNNELIKANTELDRFVYSASHDLRAPLSSISGLIALQKMEKPATTDYLNMMEDRLNILNKFISDIIDYSRNSRVEVVCEKILIKEFVTEILGVLKNPTFHDTLKINIDTPEYLEIYSDPSRLRVILNNLLHNAIKYADPSKENSMIWITASLEGNVCSIEIKDNGIGIATDLQPRIFEMFFRATSLSTGSGLGLYIVKESLEKIGGSIVFESLPGKGSTFCVRVPAQPAAPAGSVSFVSPESVLQHH